MPFRSAVFEHLGGAHVLGVAPGSVADWHALIDEGVPCAALEVVKKMLALNDAEIARLVGVSTKTFSRLRVREGRLDPGASDRLYRVVRIATLAIEVLESEAAAIAWLKRPQVGLGGHVPLDLLRTDAGTIEIERLLQRIEHGVYS